MKNIKITIKQIEGKEGNFIAFSKSEFLKATFCLCFNDSVYGCLAVHDFAEMLKRKYETDKVTFVISNEKITFRSPELLDLMMNRKRA